MYPFLPHTEMKEQIEFLTKELVRNSSITQTTGERAIADQIKHWISQFPYFQQNPHLLWEQDIPGDEFGRKNIFAFIKANPDKRETIIYHSHIDTVDVQDFGSLKKKAFNPDELVEFFKTYKYDPFIQKEAQSGEWLFGRGSLDMKSGVAIHLANLYYFSENTNVLNGNLLVMFNPDEESQHRGILSAIAELERLKEEYNLEYICAINNDFTSPIYEGDNNRYIYTGFAGKVLPSFFIYGREVHVGETIKGIDSTLIASEINKRVHNNMELAEHIEGEVIMPPSCLYLRDRKTSYTVQTPFKTSLYFNYFLYEEKPSDCIRKLKQKAREACDEIEHHLKSNYETYSKRLRQPDSTLSWKIEVQTIEEYINYLTKKGISVEETIQKANKDFSHLEIREKSFKIVEALQELDIKQQPRVLLFFAPPYCPNHTINHNKEKNQTLITTIQNVALDFSVKSSQNILIREFFPFLADSSYIACQESDEEIEILIRNFMKWDASYSLPIKDIKALDIPSINLGVYGKDGHKWTERVHKPYSFEILPQMIRTLTITLLKNSKENHLHIQDELA